MVGVHFWPYRELTRLLWDTGTYEQLLPKQPFQEDGRLFGGAAVDKCLFGFLQVGLGARSAFQFVGLEANPPSATGNNRKPVAWKGLSGP